MAIPGHTGELSWKGLGTECILDVPAPHSPVGKGPQQFPESPAEGVVVMALNPELRVGGRVCS